MLAYHHTIQVHDTDAYGIIFFAKQLHFCHDAWQAVLAESGYALPIDRVSAETLLVIVHAEADYRAALRIGDRIRIEVCVAAIGGTSFTIAYAISRADGSPTGTARIVHVALDPATNAKVPVPPRLRAALERIGG